MILVLHRARDYASLRRIRVSVDGKVVAALAPRDCVQIPVSPGRHTLTCAIDWVRGTPLGFEGADTDVVHVKVWMPLLGRGSSLFVRFRGPAAQIVPSD